MHTNFIKSINENKNLFFLAMAGFEEL